MIRGLALADFFTIGNAACGMLAVLHAMRSLIVGGRSLLWLAAVLLVLAAVLDLLDGRIARWRHRASALGRELDSLADVVSFGVAPAAIAYAAGLRSPLDQAILVYFAACGVSRLARFNVTAEALAGGTGKVPYFEGTPIPTSLVALFLTLGAGELGGPWSVGFGSFELHLAALLFAVSGTLMISKTLRIPKF